MLGKRSREEEGVGPQLWLNVEESYVQADWGFGTRPRGFGKFHKETLPSPIVANNLRDISFLPYQIYLLWFTTTELPGNSHKVQMPKIQWVWSGAQGSVLLTSSSGQSDNAQVRTTALQPIAA